MTPWWIDWPGPGRLGVSPRPRGGDWLADDLTSLRLHGVDVVVSALTPHEERELGLDEEERLAKAAGLGLVRMPIPDFAVPELNQVAPIFAQLAGRLASGVTIVAHCRMGVGRSPLIAASLLVTVGVDVEEAWHRVGLARGTRVPDTDAQLGWVERYAIWVRASSGG